MNKDVCCPWRARERGKGWESTGKVIKRRKRGRGRRGRRRKVIKKRKKERNKQTNKRGEEERKKERERKKKFLRWIFKTQQTRYNWEGARREPGVELISNGDPYYTLFLRGRTFVSRFRDFRCASSAPNEGKETLEFPNGPLSAYKCCNENRPSIDD